MGSNENRIPSDCQPLNTSPKETPYWRNWEKIEKHLVPGLGTIRETTQKRCHPKTSTDHPLRTPVFLLGSRLKPILLLTQAYLSLHLLIKAQLKPTVYPLQLFPAVSPFPHVPPSGPMGFFTSSPRLRLPQTPPPHGKALPLRKWKWSSDLKGPLKIPQRDTLAHFRVKAPSIERICAPKPKLGEGEARASWSRVRMAEINGMGSVAWRFGTSICGGDSCPTAFEVVPFYNSEPSLKC